MDFVAINLMVALVQLIVEATDADADADEDCTREWNEDDDDEKVILQL